MDQWPYPHPQGREEGQGDFFSVLRALQQNQTHAYGNIQALTGKVDQAVSAIHGLDVKFEKSVSDNASKIATIDARTSSTSVILDKIDRTLSGDDHPNRTSMMSRLASLEDTDRDRKTAEKDHQKVREEEGRKWKWWLLGILAVLLTNIIIGGFALWKVSLMTQVQQSQLDAPPAVPAQRTPYR